MEPALLPSLIELCFATDLNLYAPTSGVMILPFDCFSPHRVLVVGQEAGYVTSKFSLHDSPCIGTELIQATVIF